MDAAEIGRRLGRIKQALAEDSENPAALAEMGGVLLLKGLSHRAVQLLARAVELEPDNARFQELHAQALRMKQEE